MVLLPNNLLGSPEVQRDAEAFASRAVELIEGNKVLWVLQGEVAAAAPGDGPSGIGSDSATTCHIVAFRNPATGRTCLSHLDSPRQVAAAVTCMLRLVSHVGGVGCGIGDGQAAVEEPLDLYVVGGYIGKACSEELSTSLLSALRGSRRIFRVVLACMGRLNSVPSSARDGKKEEEEEERPRAHAATSNAGGGAYWLPRQTGLAVDLATGRAYPVRFEGRCAGWEVRSSRLFAGSRENALTEIYDPRTDCIVISPFPVLVDPRWLIQMLSLPDRDLLARTSTSPEAEDKRFVPNIRAHFSYMLANSGVNGEAWFKNVFGAGRGNPLVFPRATAAGAAAAPVAAATSISRV